MKYTKQSFSVEIIGERHGTLWAGYDGRQEIHKVAKDNDTITSLVKRVLTGDFQEQYLSDSTYLRITLIKFNRRIVRFFDITLFNSISEQVREL